MPKRGLPLWCKNTQGTLGVPCPECGKRKSVVVDSRATEKGTRRRRCCVACGKRFVTLEVIYPSILGEDARIIAIRRHIETLAKAFDRIIERSP